MKNSQQNSAYEHFSRLLKKISTEELKQFVNEFAGNQELFVHQFLLKFIESSEFPSKEKYEVMVSSLIQLPQWKQGFNSLEALSKLTEKADMMVEAKDFLDAFDIAISIITNKSLGNEKQLALYQQPMASSFAILSSVLKSEAGYDLKEKALKFLFTEVPPRSKHYPIALRGIWLTITFDASEDEGTLNSFLKLVGELKEKNRDQFGKSLDEADEEQLLQYKLKALEKLNRRQEVTHLIQANVRIKSFRIRLINESIASKNFEEAKHLIKDGKQIEERKGKLFAGTDWDLLNLKIAQLENDKKLIRNISLLLFINSDYDFKYYQLLKEQYDKVKWKQQIDRIVLAMKKESNFHMKGIYAAAKIYTLEQEWEKLLLLLQKNADLDFIETHAIVLFEKYPDQLLEIYRRAIRRFAEKFMGNEAYRRITDAMKMMLALRNGKETVQALLVELKVDYKNRKAFIGELRKLVV